MDVVYTLDSEEPLILSAISSKKYRGDLLAGSSVYYCSKPEISLTLQEYTTPGFTIRNQIIHFLKKIGLNIREKMPGVRLQVALKNDLQYTVGDRKVTVSEGRFTLEPNTQELLRITALRDKDYNYFFTSYSPEFIANLGLPAEKLLHSHEPRSLTPEMSGIIQDMLKAPYEQELLRFFYENKVRELLFQILIQKDIAIPGELTAREIEAIYAADSILQANLHRQMTEEDLIKKVSLNAFKLKKGFRQVFEMSVFERILHFRMERAKKLLIQTNMPEKEIASHAGYRHLTSFVAAFTKRFGISPRIFRKMSK